MTNNVHIADGSIPEFADAKQAMAILRMIGPDLSEEAAMRLLYPRTAAEIYTPWCKSNMKKAADELMERLKP